MKYRQFGKLPWNVSEVGLGTWQFGGDWGTIDETTAYSILSAAVDRGVNFFDTADVYGSGRSESIIGGFLSGCSETVYVATKLGRLEGYPDGYSRELFRRCTENSLRRLRRNTIDLMQLHCIPLPLMERGEVFHWLRELRQEGKIRAFGASVETAEEARICLQQDDLASLQVIFNIFRQQPAEAFFKDAENNGTALIIRVPLASGLLSGKFNVATEFPSADHRNYNRNGEAFSAGETFSGLEFRYGLECVESLRPQVPAGISMAAFALRWILDFPEVSVVIPGASKVAQVESNTAVSELEPFSPSLHTSLQEFYREKIEGHIRGPV
ncbi:MAG: aldo/keto reductase [Chitinispirillaceae bacterium]|nr:aldo/keto reductase [Chitinispirillaceae bacterium]